MPADSLGETHWESDVVGLSRAGITEWAEHGAPGGRSKPWTYDISEASHAIRPHSGSVVSLCGPVPLPKPPEDPLDRNIRFSEVHDDLHPSSPCGTACSHLHEVEGGRGGYNG